MDALPRIHIARQNLLVLSPLQNPITSPVSPTHSRTPSTATLTKPFPPFFPFPPPTPAPIPTPLVSPVAYSLPILGRTFSLAVNDTNNENGTSQTQIPKYEAISVKDGTSNWS